MTTTLLELNQKLSERIGDRFEGTATGGTTTTLVDAALADLTESNDGIKGWIKVTDTDDDAAPKGETRRIKASGGYTASTTTATVSRAYSATVASGDTYELHRINPADKDRMIRQAIADLFPILYLPVRSENLVVNNRLTDPGFEVYDSGFTHWTVTLGTWSEGTSIVRHGSRSAQGLSGAGNASVLSQTPTINVKELTGQTVKFTCWVYATDASAAFLRINFGFGAGSEDSDTHSGSDQWEKLSVEVTVPDDATAVQVRCHVNSGSFTAYFDLASLTVNGQPVYRYTIPSDIVHGPHRVSMQYDLSNPNGLYYPLTMHNRPREGALLRLEGMGYLTRPTTDSGTVEVDGSRAELVVAKATELLAAMMHRRERSDFWLDVRDEAIRDVARMSITPGIRMAPMGAQLPDGAYHIDADGDGSYLVLDADSTGFAWGSWRG